MDITYMVQGADGRKYGPATLDQLEAWIREGRLRAEAQLQRSDMQHWAMAQDFLELQSAFGITAPTPDAAGGTATATATRLQTSTTQADPSIVAQMKSGASWFYWVAGLSLINSLIAFSGSGRRFVLGLGTTQLFDIFGQQLGGGGKILVLMLDLLATGLFIFFGVFANKGRTWAFLIGMILFALDGIFFLIIQDWLDVAFHAFALFCLYRGFAACRRLRTH